MLNREGRLLKLSNVNFSLSFIFSGVKNKANSRSIGTKFKKKAVFK